MLPVMGTFSVLDEEPVCRFMPFDRFSELVSRRAAFFPTIANLINNDPLEGKQSAANYLIASGIAAALGHLVNESLPRSLGTFETKENLKNFPEAPFPIATAQTVFGDYELSGGIELSQVIEWQSAWLNVQCWHQSKSESVAMWRMYGGPDPSVCITSTAGKLRRSFQPGAGWQTAVGAIRYLDHNEEYVPDIDNPLYPFLCKERAYLYENEVRIFAFDPSASIQEANPDSKGVFVPVDLRTLVDRVIVSPGTNGKFLEDVSALISEPLGKSAEYSGIGRQPFLP